MDSSYGNYRPGATGTQAMPGWAFDQMPLVSDVELGSGLPPGYDTFRGYWSTPPITCRIPVQTFRWANNGGEISISSVPEGKLPLVQLELVSTNGSDLRECKSLKVGPADDSVEAFVLATRLMVCWGHSGRLRLTGDRGVSVEVHLNPKYDWTLIRPLASFVRKLLYLESAFNIGFAVPSVIDQSTKLVTEVIFRATTVGEFTIRGKECWLSIEPAALQPGKPPFSGPGTISARAADPIDLLGEAIDLGPYTITLPMAEISDATILSDARVVHSPLEFVLLDHQVRYRFENYASQVETIQAKLASFKRELAKNEPPELANLIGESIQDDVDSNEAMSISNGWLQFHDFPDAYCAWTPVIDERSNVWRVPIYLAYPGGERGAVGELVIDLQSGAVNNHTPPDVMRARGKELAKKLLDVG